MAENKTGFTGFGISPYPKKGTPIYNHRLGGPPASSSKSNSSAKSTASKTSPEPALKRPVGFSAASAMTSFAKKTGSTGWLEVQPKKNGGLWVWSKEYMENWVILFNVIEFQICSIQLILRIWWWMIESIPYTCTVIWKTFWHWWFNDP